MLPLCFPLLDLPTCFGGDVRKFVTDTLIRSESSNEGETFVGTDDLVIRVVCSSERWWDYGSDLVSDVGARSVRVDRSSLCSRHWVVHVDV